MMHHLQKLNYNRLQHTYRIIHTLPCLRKHNTTTKALVPVDDNDSHLQRKFIPITRRTLIHKVRQQSYLIPESGVVDYDNFITGLQKAISHNFHGALSDLKHFYDPLNPDKETLITQHQGSKERLDSEYDLLQKLSEQLHLASFQELSREHMIESLAEHPVYEGVQVEVDLKKYDVLRFWVLGNQEIPLYAENWVEKIKNVWNVYFEKWPRTIKTYKRVVVAVRTKKQKKLILKAFKEIPQNGLEYFLPEGRINMSKFDKGVIGTTVSVGALSVLIKVASVFSSFHISWPYAVTGVTGITALRYWNSYKNKRNKYLVNLSKSLYFKTIATNRALLTLIVDRAEDEVFKSCLLVYIFTRSENILKGVNADDITKWITMSELKVSIESWLKNRYNLDVDFNPEPALKQLDALQLVKIRSLGSNIHLSVPSLNEAVNTLPKVTVDEMLILQSEQEDELDIEDLIPENDFEIIERSEQQKQTKQEYLSVGWDATK